MSKITIKELKKFYKIYSLDRGKTQIFNSLSELGTYNVSKYLAHATKIKKGVYQVSGFEPTNKLEILLENISEYTKSLKYNTEFYNPSYRKGYFEKIVVVDYMRKIGFKEEVSGLSTNNVLFVLERKNIYQGNREEICISINGLDYWPSKENKLTETVTITLYTGNYSWIETKPVPRNPDYIIPEINALLKPLLVYDSVNDFSKSEHLKAKNIDIFIESLTSNLSVQSIDYKAQLKKSLNEVLSKLD